MKLKKILLTSLVAPSMTTLQIISSCGNHVLPPVDFATDSWETVIDVCNKGFIAFANAYVEPYKEYETEDEAKIDIQNWIYSKAVTHQTITRIMPMTFNEQVLYIKVRLIDVDHDKLSDDSGNAKFTFEFAEIIMNHIYDEEGDDGWHTPANYSTICQVCNEFIITAFPKVVRDSIKTVKKEGIYRSSQLNTPEIILSDDKVFCLSFAEINKLGYGYGDEGTPYVYYTANFYGDGYSEPKTYYGVYRSWFLRSPDVDTLIGSMRAGQVFYDGQLIGANYKTHSGISPAFCI